MLETDPETVVETIAYALGRKQRSLMNDMRIGTYKRQSAARQYVAKTIIAHLELCGFAIKRVRPPLQSHSIGTGPTPKEVGSAPAKREPPD